MESKAATTGGMVAAVIMIFAVFWTVGVLSEQLVLEGLLLEEEALLDDAPLEELVPPQAAKAKHEVNTSNIFLFMKYLHVNL